MLNNLGQNIKKLIKEYKEVKWPSAKTTINLTLYVIIVSAIITLMILGADAFFYELRSRFIIN
ncbi:preprotein translocase subunit SecE [Candidatus Dojkabacteria bacterium]|nr:preprotein translocase subunit SecE [Candidatus Dojkabacteria bacterium]